MDSRTNVELKGEPFKTFKFKTETINVKHQALILSQKNIGGDVGIWGNPNFGVWGTSKWGNEASQSFILGLSKLGLNALGDKSSEFEIVRIVPPNNIFEEEFCSTYFISTSETSTTVSTNLVTFTLTSETLVSKPVWLDSTNATTSRLTITSTSDVSNFGLYLSNLTSDTWQSTTQGINTTFTSAGNQVRYKIVPLREDLNISKLKLEVNK
jgi:hypothetical protein